MSSNYEIIEEQDDKILVLVKGETFASKFWTDKNMYENKEVFNLWIKNITERISEQEKENN